MDSRTIDNVADQLRDASPQPSSSQVADCPRARVYSEYVRDS